MSDTRNHTTRDQLADLLEAHSYTYPDSFCSCHAFVTHATYATHLADELLASDAIAAVCAAAVAETTATIEALAAKWERQEYKPGAFYPEASAYADGRDTQAEACADEIREVLSGGRTALDTTLNQARADALREAAEGLERQRDEYGAEDKAEGCDSRFCAGWLLGQTHAAEVLRHAATIDRADTGADQ